MPKPRLAALLLAAAAPSAAPAADTAGSVDIGGGRRMYVECRGEGAPAVVIVAGAKAAAADWTEAVRPASPTSSTRSAASPGLRLRPARNAGRRGAEPQRSGRRSRRTAADAAADLHALLAAAGIATPVVLVGAFLRRRSSPASTRGPSPTTSPGMVLVDALSEGLRAAETPEEWAHQRVILAGDMTETLKLYPEIERAEPDRSFDQLLAAPPMRPMPLVVLSADHPWGPLVPGFIADGTLPPDTPPGLRLRHRPRRRRWRRPSSPPACRARGMSPRPTAATRSTRTSRSSSSTRSATSSTPCVPAGPSSRPDAPAQARRPDRCAHDHR